MKLSPYTKAKNCTDLSDVETGLAELKAFLLNDKNKNVTLARRRLAKLSQKKQQFIK